MLEHVTTQFNERFFCQNPRTMLGGCERQGHFLKRIISADNFGWRAQLDEFYVRSVLDKSGLDQAKAVVTPGSKEASTAATAAQGKHVDTCSHRDYRSSAELCLNMFEMRYDATLATKEMMRGVSNPIVGSLQHVKRIA